MHNLLPLPKILEKSYDLDSLIYSSDDKFYYNSGVSKELINDIEKRQLQIYSGYYRYEKDWDSPKIYLNARGKKSGKITLKIENFLPYCYIKNEDGEYIDIYKNNVEKIIFRGPPILVKEFRESLRKKDMEVPYEADIPFVRRFMADAGDFFKPSDVIEPNIVILDVETNFPVNNNIISFALNSNGNLYFNSIHISSYLELLLDVYFRVIQYDVVTGWNIEFDIDAIENELEKLVKVLDTLKFNHSITSFRNKLLKYFKTEDFSILEKYNLIKIDGDKIYLNSNSIDSTLSKHLAIIDMLTLTRKMYGHEIKGRWSLDNVGTRLAGIGKYNIEGKHPNELQFDELVQYNVLDVVIPEYIEDILGGIRCHVLLSWMTSSLLEDVIITAVLNDIVILRAYHKDNIVLPSRPAWKEKSSESKYQAAKPMAREGKYDGILKFDIVHSYPSAVLAINASIETKDKDGKYSSPNGIRFNDNYSTFIKELKNLMKQRGNIKKKYKEYKAKYGQNHELTKKYKYIDFALKTQAAAFSHGIFGWERSRMYDPEVAGAITSTARDIIFFAMRHADLIGYRWVYQHTDSLYVNAPKEKAQAIIEYFNSIITNYCRRHNYRIDIQLEFKDYYQMIFVYSAGRNVLVPDGIDPDNDDLWEVTGMNFYRSETPEELADIEINIIKLLFKNSNKEQLLNYLKNRIKNLKNVSINKLGLIKPFNKKLEKYGRKAKNSDEIVGIPNHIKAVLRAKVEYGLEVSVGDKFMIIPIITNETIGKRKIRRKRVDIAFLPDIGLPESYKIDYENYLKSNLFGKINKMFNMSEKELYENCEKEIKELMYEVN